MDLQILTIVLGAVGFLIQFGGIIWKVGKAEQSLRELIGEHRRESDLEVAKIRLELSENVRSSEKQLASLSLFCRDEFVRKATFETITDVQAQNMKGIFDRFETRFIRVEGKLDRVLFRKAGMEHLDDDSSV